ncbi:ThuA domain-containing protein [Candidatus Sumerlaeota bacterium]|nr:ThuA domain-containing protein [Candidatus Sumerlaeota bacterium]
MRSRIALSVICVVASVVSLSYGAENRPLSVCMVSGSEEYKSDVSLTKFKDYLENGYNARCILIKAQNNKDLPGIEVLDNCDVGLFFTRRLDTDGEQLERVKKYCLSGRPIVAVRTACHGFQKWLEFDKLVVGGNYTGHFGRNEVAEIKIEAGAKNHPVLAGVADFVTTSSLYKTAPIASDCTLLMTGTTSISKGPQPVTWTRLHNGGRVFFTSLGGVEDFENAMFQRMIVNALFWTAEREVQRKK